MFNTTLFRSVNMFSHFSGLLRKRWWEIGCTWMTRPMHVNEKEGTLRKEKNPTATPSSSQPLFKGAEWCWRLEAPDSALSLSPLTFNPLTAKTRPTATAPCWTPLCAHTQDKHVHICSLAQTACIRSVIAGIVVEYISFTFFFLVPGLIATHWCWSGFHTHICCGCGCACVCLV